MTTITTINEHIARIADALSPSSGLQSRAEQFITEHGDDVKTSHSPRVTAAGAVYAATCVHNTGHTQADVSDAADVSRQSVGQAYRTILDTYERDQYR